MGDADYWLLPCFKPATRRDYAVARLPEVPSPFAGEAVQGQDFIDTFVYAWAIKSRWCIRWSPGSPRFQEFIVAHRSRLLGHPQSLAGTKTGCTRARPADRKQQTKETNHGNTTDRLLGRKLKQGKGTMNREWRFEGPYSFVTFQIAAGRTQRNHRAAEAAFLNALSFNAKSGHPAKRNSRPRT